MSWHSSTCAWKHVYIWQSDMPAQRSGYMDAMLCWLVWVLMTIKAHVQGLEPHVCSEADKSKVFGIVIAL